MVNAEMDFEFPSELLVRPLVPIGVTGLDTLNNAIHRSVWEALSGSRKQDRPPVLFKLLSPSHEFLRPKAKKTQYEMHIPKGILKRAWVHKHLTSVPAVLVIFYDLDWDDPHWEERMLECTSRVQSMRVALEGRSTRICVVLIQQKPSMPSDEDPLAADRASALMLSADLNQKSLFILPNVNNINGFTARLEKAFFELSTSYYSHEVRSIKSHREHLNKKTHYYLFVRHHFKMAFFSELKGDLHAAHTLYLEAYNNLFDVRWSDTNEFEIKTCAGFIAYKICRALFLLNKPKEAISHFKAHIEHYRTKMGHPQLLFQHYAWLSKQYSMFGDLYAEMVHVHGIAAAQTQHPGFYYQLAAKHAINRKDIALQLCPEDITYPSQDPLENTNQLEFFGQRAWRACKLSVEPLDPDTERLGVQAIQFIERKQIKHSVIIIGLLGNAITQFKTYRCPRMRRQLVVKMADEYYAAKDYGKALTLLTHMLWDYRIEKWLLIFDKLLSTALSCAYLTASPSDYVSLTIEALARLPQPQRLLSNLKSISQGGVPEPEPVITDSLDLASAAEAWAASVSSLKNKDPTAYHPITVDMTNVFSPIHCKATVSEALHNSVVILVHLRSELVDEIKIANVSACLGLSSSTCETKAIEPGPYTLSPDVILSFTCKVQPQIQDVAKPVQIVSVLVLIGSPEGREIILKFTGLPQDHSYPHPELLHFRCKTGNECVDKFSSLETVVTKEIARRQPRCDLLVEMSEPALLSDWFPVLVTVKSRESSSIHSIKLSVTLCDQTTEQHTIICEKVGSELMSLPLMYNHDSLDAGKEFSYNFLVKSTAVGERQFNVQVTYIVEGDECLLEKVVRFNVVEVFELTTKFMNKKFDILSNVYSRETFLVQAKITSLSPWPVIIESTSFSLGDNVEFETDYTCSLSGSLLVKNAVGLCVACLKTDKPSDKAVKLASLTINWSRKTDGDETASVNTMTVDCVTSIEDTPVTVSLEPPVCSHEQPLEPNANALQPSKSCLHLHHRVRVAFPVVYKLTNHTSFLLSFRLNMEASEAFMFSGHKQVIINLLPESTSSLHYVLCPLVAGPVVLPRLRLSPLTPAISHALITHILDRMLPTALYILPPIKQLNQEETKVPTITL